MTVILAVRCFEGLVLASDSQATAQAAGGTPVRFDAPKIDKLGKHILFAGTGAQGCSQRVKAALDPHAAKFSLSKPKGETASSIHGLANTVQKESYGAFVQYAKEAQPEAWGGIFCGWAKDGPWIMEIDLNGGWQFHDPVAATGSGYAFAYLAIAHVQHYDVGNQPLNIAQAIAYRAIETTCTVSAFGVGLPVQMGVVLAKGASQLGAEEIDGIKDSVNLWKEQEQDSLGVLAGGQVPSDEAQEGLDAPE